jgi:hypothetical protein
VVAFLTHLPRLFPSLGPTVMLHVERPAEPPSSPGNTLIGHGIALLAGYGLLKIQLDWLRTRIKQAAPQALIVAVHLHDRVTRVRTQVDANPILARLLGRGGLQPHGAMPAHRPRATAPRCRLSPSRQNAGEAPS